MIDSTSHFLHYFDGIRKRTLNYIRALPPDKINWSPREGEYTCADIVRHIASGEKMFVGVALNSKWKYEGHEGKQTYEELLTYLDQIHSDAMDALKTLPDAELNQPRPALEGDASVKAWRWLMAMTEHEIHHRSQLAIYLFLLGVKPPHIYGLGVEELITKATG